MGDNTIWQFRLFVQALIREIQKDTGPRVKKERVISSAYLTGALLRSREASNEKVTTSFASRARPVSIAINSHFIR